MQALTYNEHPIAIRGEMLNLTDMWKAAGSDASKRPADWARKEGREFIEHMAMILNVPQGHIQTQRGGSGAGRGRTIAHWQIGLAYAKYLSAEFHMWCNTVVRERMEAKAVAVIQEPVAIDMKAVGGMIKGVIRKALDDAINDMLPAAVEARLAADPKLVAAQDYIPAVQVAIDRKINQKGRRRIAQLISNRLSRFCEANDYRVRRDWSGRKLFDRAAVRHWLVDGGWAPVQDLLESLGRQTNLFLVPGGSKSK